MLDLLPPQCKSPTRQFLNFFIPLVFQHILGRRALGWYQIISCLGLIFSRKAAIICAKRRGQVREDLCLLTDGVALLLAQGPVDLKADDKHGRGQGEATQLVQLMLVCNLQLRS